MAHTAAAQQSPSSVPKRPKGILKNSASFQATSPPDTRMSPTSERPSGSIGDHDLPAEASSRPGMPAREFSEKEITQMNTEINAGGGHRRTGSNPRGGPSRRQSSQSTTSNGVPNGVPNGEHDESGMRLKWDEANLYLNEGQMGGKMKIDEPKTPFVHNYDAADEEEEELENINAQDLAVDELDMNKAKPVRARQASGARARENDIPGLDLGEPEIEPLVRRESDGERKVHVDNDKPAEDDGRHGEQQEDMSLEELEKHKKFEEMRKKHYEMKNIKNLLGHPEQLDALDDEDDG